MIKLTDELFYDTELSFDEHIDEVKSFINNIINNTNPTSKTEEPAGVWPRPLKEVWEIVEGLKIAKIYNYVYPATHENNGEHTFRIERTK